MRLELDVDVREGFRASREGDTRRFLEEDLCGVDVDDGGKSSSPLEEHESDSEYLDRFGDSLKASYEIMVARDG